MNYWLECIKEAFEESGIIATDDQLNIVVEVVAGAHDNYSTANGYDCIPNPLAEDNERLKRSLKEEKEKVFVKNVRGREI